VNLGAIHAEGVTLRFALAIAYEIPGVRIIGPDSVLETRLALDAVAENESSFHPFLRQELQNRLQLAAQVESGPFDVFVLTAAGTPRLERAHANQEPGTRIHESDAELQSADMTRLAAALQSILGKPVVDETGIRGNYDLKF